MITITNEDNMELMKRYPDNHFDLAIVDPPYGIDVNKMNLGDSNKKRKKEYKKDGKQWDNQIPDEKYFKELFRVSKNQIVWGANYMTEHLKGSMGWVYWDKQNGTSDFSDGELAFTSFNRALRSFKFHLSRDRDKRFHPTQKPVKLYEWLLINYAEPNQKILDTHLGSGGIAVAVDNLNKLEKMNLTLTACELDKGYYESAQRRIQEQTNWQSLF